MKYNQEKSKRIYLFTLLDLRTVDFFFLRFGGLSSVTSDCLSEVTVTCCRKSIVCSRKFVRSVATTTKLAGKPHQK